MDKQGTTKGGEGMQEGANSIVASFRIKTATYRESAEKAKALGISFAAYTNMALSEKNARAKILDDMTTEYMERKKGEQDGRTGKQTGSQTLRRARTKTIHSAG